MNTGWCCHLAVVVVNDQKSAANLTSLKADSNDVVNEIEVFNVSRWLLFSDNDSEYFTQCRVQECLRGGGGGGGSKNFRATKVMEICLLY